MIKVCLIALGLLAAATAIPLPPIDYNDLLLNISSSDNDLLLNISSSAYNPTAAVAYARANCASGPGLCAEFASRAMAAGGAGNPIMPRVVDLIAVRAHGVATRSCFTTFTHAPHAVDESQRLEDDRLHLLRATRSHSHLRHDPRRQQPRGILHGRRTDLPAQPLPLQVAAPPFFIPSPNPIFLSFLSFCLRVCLALSRPSRPRSTNGAWGNRRVFCRTC